MRAIARGRGRDDTGTGTAETRPGLAAVTTDGGPADQARRRHPATGGRRPGPPRRDGPPPGMLGWSLVVGALAAAAVLWIIVLGATVVMYGSYLELQTQIITRLDQLGPCEPSGPYGAEARIPGSAPGASPFSHSRA